MVPELFLITWKNIDRNIRMEEQFPGMIPGKQAFQEAFAMMNNADNIDVIFFDISIYSAKEINIINHLKNKPAFFHFIFKINF